MSGKRTAFTDFFVLLLDIFVAFFSPIICTPVLHKKNIKVTYNCCKAFDRSCFGQVSFHGVKFLEYVPKNLSENYCLAHDKRSTNRLFKNL